MSGLVEFLWARLDEDEALAREAPPGPWQIGNAVDPTQPCNVNTFPSARLVADGLNWLAAEHIARHNPARVLAEITVKRELIRTWAALSDAEIDGFALGAASKALQLHAAVYADHPDYREEWRP